MRLLRRPIYVGTVAAVGLATVALTGAYAATAASASSTPQFAALPNSVAPTTDHITGAHHSSRMSIELTLAPRSTRSLNNALRAAYTKGSSSYHQWLAKGQFDARYAPSRAERDAISRYLRSAGLKVGTSSSPFLVKASGSSQQIESALRTTLSNYKNRKGVSYFSNSRAVRLPKTISGQVLGVVGLTNTVRLQTNVVRTPNQQVPHRSTASSAGTASSCETGYPTTSDFFNLVNNGTNFADGYGGGPDCVGLTPSQTNSLYGAPNAGARAKGKGASLGLFELSAYQASDIATWAHQFYGPHYNPPLSNVIIDGGPLNPICPAGDQCPPQFEGYSGDIEVDADIEMSLAVAPDARNVVVYNAPNDFTGQTVIDEYNKIASADAVSTISSSWGVCENDLEPGQAQAENLAFEQMALQGQSMFTSSGDTGAFGCIRGDGTIVQNAGDPASQPWVTGVGGTSFESDNPGTNEHPGTAKPGVETVWNTDNLCSNQAAAPSNDNQTGYFWCNFTGAGGGGVSDVWNRPFYQIGRGVGHSTFRETPDVSADADPYTGYAEYCTGNASTVESFCGTFSSGQPTPGWFGIGGTSLSSPLWSALIADRNAFQGRRTGNVNPLVYALFNLAPNRYFNDITGVGPLQQAANNNGLYPTTPGYDQATGVGSPKFAAWITS